MAKASWLGLLFDIEIIAYQLLHQLIAGETVFAHFLLLYNAPTDQDTGFAIDDAAQLSPAIRNLVNRYGDNAVASLASNPRRVQLVETLGDDAAEALLKHQNIAEKALHLCPDAEVSSALKNMDRASGQYLAMCSAKHDLSPDDLKNVVLIVHEGGEKAAASLSRLTPEKLEKVLYTAQVAGIAAAATMVVSIIPV